MADLTKCSQCDQPNIGDGVYTSDGCYICSICCDALIFEANLEASK